MAEHDSRTQRYRAAVIAICQKEDWALSDSQIEDYVEQIVARVPEAELAIHLDEIIRYFHKNIQLVDALSDSQHALHAQGWGWVGQVVSQVIHFKKLDWSWDRSVEFSDLLQVVQLEIARSLHNYRFRSSLHTWIQSVTKRRLSRFHRDTNAEKRPKSVYGLERAELYHAAEGNPEAATLPHLMIDYIRSLLEASTKPRDAAIFHMYAIEDQSTVEIGKRVALHPSRVRALLQHAREVLQDDETICAWLKAHEESAVGNEYTYNNSSRNTM